MVSWEKSDSNFAQKLYKSCNVDETQSSPEEGSYCA